VDKQILEVREAQRAARLKMGSNPGLEEEEDEDMEVEEVDAFSPFSDGDMSEAGDGYFAATHAAEVDRGHDGAGETHGHPGKEILSGKLPNGGPDRIMDHERASSQDTHRDATNPKININMHEEDSSILRQTRTLDSVKESDERPHEATASPGVPAAQCALCIENSNSST